MSLCLVSLISAKMKFTAPILAAALQLAGAASAQTEAEIAANLERYWSYGGSDPVYPTRMSLYHITNLD